MLQGCPQNSIDYPLLNLNLNEIKLKIPPPVPPATFPELGSNL